MTENETDLLPDSVLELNTKRRKQLLPWWIKVFIWLFLIFGLLAPLALVYGIFGSPFELSLYGLTTYEPASAIGIMIILLFMFKGFTAFSLLTEKDWAVTISIIDAGTGVMICTLLMLYPLVFPADGFTFVIRLELILLIPYLIKLFKIKTEWERIQPFK